MLEERDILGPVRMVLEHVRVPRQSMWVPKAMTRTAPPEVATIKTAAQPTFHAGGDQIRLGPPPTRGFGWIRSQPGQIAAVIVAAVPTFCFRAR